MHPSLGCLTDRSKQSAQKGGNNLSQETGSEGPNRKVLSQKVPQDSRIASCFCQLSLSYDQYQGTYASDDWVYHRPTGGDLIFC